MNIIAAMIAPEIKPNVKTILFITTSPYQVLKNSWRNLVSETSFVVILSGDFTFLRANHTFELRDEPHFFSNLYGLSAAARAEFVEEPARVSFDGVFADEEFVGDLAVAEALR